MLSFISILLLQALLCTEIDANQNDNIVVLDYDLFNMERAIVEYSDDGNFIIGDPDNGKVMIFNANGELERSFGEKGRGPGEFSYLIDIIQLKDGDYLISDLAGKIERFDSLGQHLTTYLIPVIGKTANIVEINSNTLLIAGLHVGAEGNTLLHFLNLETGEIESFFDAPFEMSDYGGLLHSMSVFSNALFDGTHIIAFISFSDSMYIFDLEGQLLDEKRLSGYNSFEPLEPFSQELNDEQLLEKMTSYSIITNVFWKDEHTIILEHMKNVNVEQSPFSHSVEYSMAVLNLDGEFLHEDSDFFRAYGYDNASQMLISGHNCITKTAAPLIEYSTLNVE